MRFFETYSLKKFPFGLNLLSKLALTISQTHAYCAPESKAPNLRR